MRSYILPGLLFVILALTTLFMVRQWIELGDVEISLLGWIMMAGGVVFAAVIGGGLMALAFYSDRRGHDDAHHDQSVFDPRKERSDDDSDQGEQR